MNYFKKLKYSIFLLLESHAKVIVVNSEVNDLYNEYYFFPVLPDIGYGIMCREETSLV